MFFSKIEFLSEQINRRNFSCWFRKCACCGGLTFHVETSEQYWHRKNRPYPEKATHKKSLSSPNQGVSVATHSVYACECVCDFCGPFVNDVHSCIDAMRSQKRYSTHSTHMPGYGNDIKNVRVSVCERHSRERVRVCECYKIELRDLPESTHIG